MNSYSQFKYRSINKNFFDALIKGYIFCANAKNLNDPFDCQIDIISSLKNAINKTTDQNKSYLQYLLSEKSYIENLQHLATTTGICSFSESLLNSVMWSHYADEHKGVCLLYDFPIEFIDVQNTIIGIIEMNYNNNRLTEWFIENASTLPDLNAEDTAIEISKVLFSTKGKDWKYEGEIRIMSLKEGEIKIDKSYLTQVCFGLHTPERDRDLVQKIIIDSGYKVDFCEIVKNESDFGLMVKDL